MNDIVFFKQGSFVLSLDMSLYSRPVVLKVLNRWTHVYTISLSKTKEDTLLVELQSSSVQKIDNEKNIKKILDMLLYEMQRMEIINQTAGIRELLVGRALYATCIEANTKPTITQPDTNIEKWQIDKRRIFESWTKERE